MPNKVAIPYYYGIARWPVLLTINLVNEASSKYFIRGGKNMDFKFKYLSKDKKKKKERQIELEYSNDKSYFEIFLNTLVVLLTSATFLGFVVKIVKIIMNGSFYYFCNNRIFIFKEVNYGSG